MRCALTRSASLSSLSMSCQSQHVAKNHRSIRNNASSIPLVLRRQAMRTKHVTDVKLYLRPAFKISTPVRSTRWTKSVEHNSTIGILWFKLFHVTRKNSQSRMVRMSKARARKARFRTDLTGPARRAMHRRLREKYHISCLRDALGVKRTNEHDSAKKTVTLKYVFEFTFISGCTSTPVSLFFSTLSGGG